MTREEEIIKTADNYCHTLLYDYNEYDMYDAFIAGAEWADVNNPIIVNFEHYIEQLGDKLQASTDFNKLLLSELKKAKSPLPSAKERLSEDNE